jgi:hypothetical protein
MIKVNELRIGNIIGWRDGFNGLIIGKAFEVHGDKIAISPAVKEGEEGGQGFMLIRGVEPIPLTPEWLERCGMELRDKDKVWQIQVGNSLYLEIEAEDPFMAGVTPETWRDQCPIYIWSDIKHIHQLQNLYHSLTGEELQIKMP